MIGTDSLIIEYQRPAFGAIAIKVNGQISRYYLSKQPRRYNAGWHLIHGDKCIARGDLRHVKARAEYFIADDMTGAQWLDSIRRANGHLG